MVSLFARWQGALLRVEEAACPPRRRIPISCAGEVRPERDINIVVVLRRQAVGRRPDDIRYVIR